VVGLEGQGIIVGLGYFGCTGAQQHDHAVEPDADTANWRERSPPLRARNSPVWWLVGVAGGGFGSGDLGVFAISGCDSGRCRAVRETPPWRIPALGRGPPYPSVGFHVSFSFSYRRAEPKGRTQLLAPERPSRRHFGGQPVRCPGVPSRAPTPPDDAVTVPSANNAFVCIETDGFLVNFSARQRGGGSGG